jgi:hypothetical protein
MDPRTQMMTQEQRIDAIFQMIQFMEDSGWFNAEIYHMKKIQRIDRLLQNKNQEIPEEQS